jgi:cysteine desulfurase / selenocysteine lyase
MLKANRESPELLGRDQLDVERLRRDTPAVEHLVHFNNAGAALPPMPVLDTVIGHLRREAEIGGYEAAHEASERLGAVKSSIVELIGAAGAHEIALVEHATRAWQQAAFSFPFGDGRRVVTGRSEYASNAIGLLQLATAHRLTITVVDDDTDGQIDLAALDRELAAGDVDLVALTYLPTSGGLVNPAAEVGAACRRHGVAFLLDACQAVGQLPVDVDELQCDFLSATGRKFLRAPRATGFLYVREDWIERLSPPALDLRSAIWTAPESFTIAPDARRFEDWESNVAAQLGLGAAVDYALEVGVDAGWQRLQALAAALRMRLHDRPDITVHDRGANLSGIVTFAQQGEEPERTSERLRAAGINTSVAAASSSQLDFPRRGLDTAVRASVHYYNTVDEVDRLMEAL